MKRFILPSSCLSAGISALSMLSSTAGVIIRYDSAGDASNQLSIVGTTDSAFVMAADATTSVDAETQVAGPHPSQTNVQGPFGTANDLHFRFGGSGAGSNINYALTPANALTENWIGTGITAAQDMVLDEFSFHLFNNSANGSTYAARDVGLFASIDGGTSFSRFGDLFDSATGNGNQGTVTFSDSLAIMSGQTVELRLLFTKRTNTAENLQAATRVGDIVISGSVPEPSASLLGGLGVLALLRRRRG